MVDSPDARNPSGGASGRRASMQPALELDLMSRGLDTNNVSRAWKQVQRNGGAPDHYRPHWVEIRHALMEGTYRPAPVRQAAIPKPGGGERLLGIATVLDRVIQQSIAQVLTPLFDPLFSESSFGFRPKRSAHGAVKRVQQGIRKGYRVAVDLDLENFFGLVDHDVLMARVSKRVSDPVLLRLIGRYLRAGVVVDGKLAPTPKGVPQGSPFRRFSRTSCSTASTRSWSGAGTTSHATRMMLSSSYAARGQVNA